MNFDSSEIIPASDLSHHQGYPPRFPVVDFQKMKAWGFKGCVMRASHGPFADRAFVYNWPACKGVLPRSSYHYYENWSPPKAQVKKYWETVGGDFEGIAWLDLEDRLAGDYGHWDDWYQWLEELKVISGLPSERIGIYTGHYYFTEMLRGATAVQRAYFRQYALWLAWYFTDPLKPIFTTIPPTLPWTDAETAMVQTGTPVIGLAAGVGSKELDYNRVNGRSNYIKMFGNLEPQPEPQPGETMNGRIKTLTNIRNSPPGGTYQDIGDLLAGDLVTGETQSFNGVQWWHLTSATRNGQPVITLGGLTVAQRTDCWAYGPNIELIAPAPGTLPVLNVTVSGEGYITQIVELRPKV